MNRFFGKLFEDSLGVDTHYRIGMRVVKTIAAVAICLSIAWFVEGGDSLPIAAIAAIVTMQATRTETLKIGIFRILGTIIGGAFGIIAVLIGLIAPYYAQGLFIIVIPVMLLLNLYVCNLLNMRDSCAISCVVTIIVGSHILVDASIGDSLAFTFIRVRDTLIGVCVATIINLLPELAQKFRKNKAMTVAVNATVLKKEYQLTDLGKESRYMKLKQVAEILDAKVYTSFPYGEIEVSAACGSDLMSDALAFGEGKGLLLTGLNNPQCIRTAEMMDIRCVVLVRGKDPDKSVVSLADEKNIVVMKTDHLMFTSCGLLYEAGLSGGKVDASS